MFRFGTQLAKHANRIMQMRYVEKRGVAEVLLWLSEQGIACSDSNFHKQLGRILKKLPDDEAERVGVDLDLLRAVRRRLRMPLRPRGPRAGTIPIRRFFSGSIERRVWVKSPMSAPSLPSPRSATQPPPLTPSHNGQHPNGTRPAASRAPVIAPDPLAPPKTLDDWRAVQARAVKKIPTNIMNNWHGTVVDMDTDRSLNQAELMERFRLTEHEAESLFLTL